MNEKKDEPFAFESAFARLEQILEKMNSGSLTLDDSLKHYEEADQLIGLCNDRLTQAERKIETLIKTRNGEIDAPGGEPVREPFNPFAPEDT